jgi:hypothetical protein
LYSGAGLVLCLYRLFICIFVFCLIVQRSWFGFVFVSLVYLYFCFLFNCTAELVFIATIQRNIKFVG